MTITGWKQVATHVVDRLEVRTEGRDIFVDIYMDPWCAAAEPLGLEEL
ncbi:MAG: hypothetical protein JW955_23610 [Sedimentisphaerales bacterium]|nr:hypothetical protein [Sedimentisphaerales bacterium]